MITLTQRVADLGHILPAVKTPAANYLSTTIGGDLLVISGQIGGVGAAAAAGPVGSGLSVEEAKLDAQVAALGVLAAINAHTDGDMTRIVQVLRLGVFIAAAPAFYGLSQVADGASNLLTSVLGDAGRHARTAVGVASLPSGAAVEVDALVRLRPSPSA